MPSASWVSAGKSPLSGDALQCGSGRLGEDYRWRRRNYRDGHRCGGVTLKNKRPELGGVSPDKEVVRQEAAFILDSHAGELSVGRTAENDVAGVIGVFKKGGVGIFAGEAIRFSNLRVRR